MRLSTLLKGECLSEPFKLIEEKEFESLGLLESKTDLTLLSFLGDIKYADKIQKNITMLITKKEFVGELKEYKAGLILSDEPRLLFFHIHNSLCGNNEYVRTGFRTQISEFAEISDLSYIAKENVVIEDGVIIEPFACVLENSWIGTNSIIRSGAKIGGCGFEFKRDKDTILSVRHYGGVVIGQNVEIQNNSCIDRAIYPWDDTWVGDNTKIDNLVHIGHAVKIGKNVLIAAGAAIGGRTEIKDNSWIGVGSIVRNGLEIGQNARVNMGAVVTKTVSRNESMTGNFAIPHHIFISNLKNGLDRIKE